MPFPGKRDAEAIRAGRRVAKAKRVELAVVSVEALERDQSPRTKIPDWAKAHLAKTRKCGDCSCWQQIEIRECTVVSCPLWAFRPYQREELSEEQRRAAERGKPVTSPA
jgi:hypothetical protein